jgi:hypothetical protein
MSNDVEDQAAPIQEERRWSGNGWTAQVIKSEDGEGWSVAMSKDGESEPALVGPWTMGRDKKNPKPLEGNAFFTLVKTASEFVRRHEQQMYAMLNQSVVVSGLHNQAVTVQLTIFPESDEPYGQLTAVDYLQEQIATKRVAATFKLNRASGQTWVDSLLA